MSYESKLYIVNRLSNGSENVFEEIASFDLCHFVDEDDVKKVFNTPIDAVFYVDGQRAVEDDYGRPICMAEMTDAIRYVRHLALAAENYRRLKPALALLTNFDPTEWEDLKVIHYGH